jgi:hypothetical protein
MTRFGRRPKASCKLDCPIIEQLTEVLMMQHIRFRIVGGTSTLEALQWPCRDDVRQEAQRRLNASGYTRCRARALATGADMPEAMRHFALQVNFVVDKLTTLRPIPQDFQSDTYWPVSDSAH